jgi:hypothetical protein
MNGIDAGEMLLVLGGSSSSLITTCNGKRREFAIRAKSTLEIKARGGAGGDGGDGGCGGEYDLNSHTNLLVAEMEVLEVVAETQYAQVLILFIWEGTVVLVEMEETLVQEESVAVVVMVVQVLFFTSKH